MRSLFRHIVDKSHVIWDWNGTLMDDLDACLGSLNHLLTMHGRPPMDAQASGLEISIVSARLRRW